MQFLYFLESLRNPVCDTFFSAVTYLGSEVVFIAVFLLLFWCGKRDKAYFLLLAGLMGMTLNLLLKIVFRIPRPWILDPSFSIVESARASASGYSFPSGHTQCAVTVFGAFFLWAKKRWIRVLSLLPILLVPLSRMYLGVHTPLDVSVSFVLAVLLLLVLSRFTRDLDAHPKTAVCVIGLQLLLVLGACAYVTFYRFSADISAENLASAVKNAFTFLGISTALLPGYFCNRRIPESALHTVWRKQLLRIAFGVLVLFLVNLPLDTPTLTVFGTVVRYFLLSLCALLMPLAFFAFSRLQKRSKKNGDNGTEAK